MTLTDPIADMLTRVRNAQSVGKETVSMPSSKKLVEIDVSLSDMKRFQITPIHITACVIVNVHMGNSREKPTVFIAI